MTEPLQYVKLFPRLLASVTIMVVAHDANRTATAIKISNFFMPVLHPAKGIKKQKPKHLPRFLV